jgi:REP element-mobilizing transposase RayT
MPYPERLHHDVPGWVESGSLFHIRIRSESDTVLIDSPGTKAQAILAAAREYHERDRWFCRLMLVMPDHLHAMLAFPRDTRMSAVIGSWKGYLAKACGARWQDGYFDHRLRSRKESDECWRYIRQNPVRAGLVAEEEQWKFVWSPTEILTPN